MSRHIIRAFIVMTVIWRILRDHLVEVTFKILPDCRIGVFVQAQAGRGVFDECLQHSDSDFLQVGKLLLDNPSD